MNWFCVIAFSVIVEGIVEYAKLASARFAESGMVIPAAAALGVAVCTLYRCDLLALLGLVTPVPYVGCVLTGLLVARGSNYAYDLVGRLTEVGTAHE